MSMMMTYRISRGGGGGGGRVVHSYQTGEKRKCLFLFIVMYVLLLVYLTRVLLGEAGRLARGRRRNSRVPARPRRAPWNADVA